MANTLKPKRSSVAGNIPTTTNLASGEVAVNMADQKVWINNGTSVVQVGSGKLSGLADVVLSSLATGQGLSWNGTNWVNSSAGSGSVTSVSGTGTVSGLTLTGSVTTSGSLTLGGTLSLTSGQVTTALGFTPYNATNPSGYITGSGNAATATALQTARTINGAGFNGSANIDTTEWFHSDRDFPNGTLITTNINYAVSSGDPFVLEIRGNSYGNIVPLDLLYQGYIYADTIINHGGLSNGLSISGLVAINNGGNLCFWFPSQGYWNGYNVKVYTAYATRATNRVTSITGVAKPTTAKEVALSANIRQSLHSSNYTSYSPSLTGSGASGTWGINVTGTASSISGYNNPTTAATANTIAYRDSAGDISAREIVLSSGLSTAVPTVLVSMYPTTNQMVRTSPGAVASAIQSAASGTWGISITGSAGSVSGFKSFGQIAINPNGANANCTTAQFIAHLTSIGMFNFAHSVAKCSWDYAGNNDLTDTGFGTVDMAGCVIETWINNSEKHVRITRPTTGAGGFQVLIYNDQGSGYAPGWRAMMTNENIGSYAPSPTGAGASGTWGINVTGSAGSASSVSGLTLTSSANGINPDSVTQNQLGYNGSVSLFGQTDGGLYSSAHSSSWIHQIYGDFRTGQIAIRGKNSGTWQAWRTVLDSSNFTNYAPGSGSNWTFGDLYANGWLRSNNVNVGLYNQSTGSHWYSENGGSFTLGSPSTTYGEIRLRQNHQGTYKGSFYWDGSGIGLLNNQGGWSVRCNYGTGYGGTLYGDWTTTGVMTSNSDERLKKDWEALPADFIERLAKIKSGTYTRIDSGKRHAGASAQDMQNLLKETVVTADDEAGTLSLSYGNAALVSAIELAKDNLDLRTRVAKLEALVSQLIEG